MGIKRNIKLIFCAFGGMGAIYCMLELGRLIINYWRNIRFHPGFLLELFFITIGMIWAVKYLVTGLFVETTTVRAKAKKWIAKNILERK